MSHVIVAGAGNIGSHVLPHVARMAGVTAVTVIDRGRYEASNLASQNISTTDVGKSKAQAQARRLKRIDRSLDVRPIHASLEDVPLGWLRGSVILACLDSRRGRMVLNQAASRLGVPWINAGVDASGLARVQVFAPSGEAACLECGWEQRDYELVEQDYPCQGAIASPETGASSGLGALAAAMMALECEKLLAGDREHSLAGRDVMIDARHHRHYVTRFERNPACRMPDHAGWPIAPLDADPSSTTLAELMVMTGTLPGADAGMTVAGQQFALALTCPRCGPGQTTARLHRGEWRRSVSRCRACGSARAATGFDLRERVTCADLPEEARNRPLTELGLLAGDVLTFSTPDTDTHLELRGMAWPIES